MTKDITMKDTNKLNDRMRKEANSASSTSKIVFDNENNLKLTDENSSKRTRISTRKRSSSSSISQSSNDSTIIGAPRSVSTALTIIWYVCICLLFVIAFLALVLSVLYFLTDSTTEQVIKLYGITGSGSLAIVTFVIIFLDCCNDGDREEHEEEAIYRILQIKDKKDRKADRRQNRRVITKKEESPKASVTQPIHKNPPLPPPAAHHHHHHYPQPSHIHHIHAHTSSFFHHHHPHHHSLYRYPYGPHHHHRHHSDVGVDTSDRLETILKSKSTIHKAKRDAQTEPKREDVEHGTQTSTVDFDNKVKIISEGEKQNSASKITGNRLPTLNESSEQQEKDFPITQTVSEVNSTTVSDV